MSLDFYRAFEDRHRGTRESILERQRVYLPFLKPLAAAHPALGVVDVGCGRGEWLELLRREGIPARGADLDEGMLSACRERGLDVELQDAVSFLRALPDASRVAVTGFHLAEHLPFEVLQDLVAEALRVVVPGGLLVLETPNPENLVVGTASFYLDPTHQRPLPWQLLEFLAEHTGFARVKVMRLQESAALAQRQRLGLMDVLGGASPDYAIVAQKPVADGDTVLLDEQFRHDYGIALDTLALRYDRGLREDVHAVTVQASGAQQRAEQAIAQADQALAQAAQGMALANQGVSMAEDARAASHAQGEYVTHLHKDLQAQVHQLREQMAQELNQLHERAAAAAAAADHAWNAAHAAHQQLAAIYQSRSWRVTAPLRAATDAARRVRNRAFDTLTPQRVERLSAVARRMGVHGPLQALYRRARGAPAASQAPAEAAQPQPVSDPLPARERDLSAGARRALHRLERHRGDAGGSH